MAKPQFEEVGQQFVQHYYSTFDSNRAGLQPLYGDTSMLSFEGEQVQGAANIAQKYVSLQFSKVRHELVKCDCQPSPANNGILIFATGNIFVNDGPNPLKFSQVFQLCQAPTGAYFCQNDLFRLSM
mmetsp:Transcript_88062/g.152559  ORF Transcript_88062/g.152559 Transcript_88062/m.152559 type:complete len:126 (+) Transcript_88062:45-422(+)